MKATQPNYRVRFVIDSDAQFEECNGEPRPLTEAEYAGNEYQKNGQPVSYAEYRRYYGNPDRHVYLGVIVETQDPAGGKWQLAASLWGIDCMDDDPELAAVTIDNGRGAATYSPEQLIPMSGYLRLCALEELVEAGYNLPRSVKCRRKGCGFFHTDGSKYCAQHG